MSVFVRVWMPEKGLTDVPITRYDSTMQAVFARPLDSETEVILSLASFDLFNDYIFTDEQGNAISSEEAIKRLSER